MTGPLTGSTWIIVVYRVPSRPSTLRVAAWKKAKEVGSLALQQSTYLFPDRYFDRQGKRKLEIEVEW